MALFGEKCVRCHKRRTKQTYDGLPTCEDCEAELEARARATEEASQKCPADGTAMGTLVAANGSSDSCPPNAPAAGGTGNNRTISQSPEYFAQAVGIATPKISRKASGYIAQPPSLKS